MNFNVGDQVSFTSRQERHNGLVVKLNPTKARVEAEDGDQWNVPYALLQPADAQNASVATSSILPGDRVQTIQPHNGVVLVGNVIKANPARAKVKLDDGRIFNIPYEYLEKANGDSTSTPLPSNGNATPATFKVGDRVRDIKPFKGEIIVGAVIKLNSTRVKVKADDGRVFNIPYAYLVLDDDEFATAPQPYAIENTAAFNVGDHVSFGRKYGVKRTGVIARVNTRTYAVNADGTEWRVGKSLVSAI